MSMMIDRPAKPLRNLKFLLHMLGFSSPLPTALARAYDAPFPGPRYKMGPRAMPSQVPDAAHVTLAGAAAQGLGVLRFLRKAISVRLRRQRPG